MKPKALAVLAALGLLALAGPAGALEATHQLQSGGTLTAEESDQVITDRDSLDQISMQAMGGVDPTLEAYWGRDDYEVFLNYERIGFVKMDDWDELDVDALWESYLEGARDQSEQFDVEVRPLRWVIEPTLDRKNAVAYYALEVQFGEQEPLINMVVLDFGRYGYEELTLVQNSSAFPAGRANHIATRIAGAYQFGTQADYGDFQKGDKVAAVGAAGLIAAALGVKFGKGLLIAGLLLFKKFWFVLFAIPALLWRRIKAAFGTDEPEA